MTMKYIRQADAQQLIRLLGDVRQITDRQEQGRTLIDGLCSLVDADGGWFVDLQKSAGTWAPAGYGVGSVLDPTLTRYIQQFGREYPLQTDVMATEIFACKSSSFVTRWTAVQHKTPAIAREPFTDLVNTMKIADMGDPVFSLHENHRFAINLQRVGTNRRPFDQREINLMQMVATELKWLHETGRLSLTTLTQNPAPAPLPPRLQQVLDALLQGECPKRIAMVLGISLPTVREHIQRLYRLMNVNGRDELMAKCLRK